MAITNISPHVNNTHPAVAVKPAEVKFQGYSTSVVSKPLGQPTFSGRGKRVLQAFRHYANTLLQHEKALKYMTAIVASFLLILSRIFTAWKTALTAEENGEDKKFATKEAYRTTLREFGGFTFSYALLKSIESRNTKRLLANVGLGPKEAPKKPAPKYGQPLPSIGQATRQFGQHLRKILQGKALSDELSPGRVYRPYSGPDLADGDFTKFKQRYNNNGGFRRWVNLFQPKALKKEAGGLAGNLLAKGHNAVEIFRPYFKNSPMVVGGLTALGLSGFFLEWLTINKMDAITGRLSGHKGDDPVTPYSLPAPYSPAASPLTQPADIRTGQHPDIVIAQDMFTKFSQPY